MRRKKFIQISRSVYRKYNSRSTEIQKILLLKWNENSVNPFPELEIFQWNSFRVRGKPVKYFGSEFNPCCWGGGEDKTTPPTLESAVISKKDENFQNEGWKRQSPYPTHPRPKPWESFHKYKPLLKWAKMIVIVGWTNRVNCRVVFLCVWEDEKTSK